MNLKKIGLHAAATIASCSSGAKMGIPSGCIMAGFGGLCAAENHLKALASVVSSVWSFFHCARPCLLSELESVSALMLSRSASERREVRSNRFPVGL